MIVLLRGNKRIDPPRFCRHKVHFLGEFWRNIGEWAEIWASDRLMNTEPARWSTNNSSGSSSSKHCGVDRNPRLGDRVCLSFDVREALRGPAVHHVTEIPRTLSL